MKNQTNQQNRRGRTTAKTRSRGAQNDRLEKLGKAQKILGMSAVALLAVPSLLATFGQNGASGVVLEEEVTKSTPITFATDVASTLTVDVLEGADENGRVGLDLHPTFSGASFGEKDLKVAVTTNSTSGYSLAMKSSTTDLVRTQAVEGADVAKIPTLPAGSYTQDTFVVNHWGYRLNKTGNYLPFATEIPLKSSAVPVSGDATTVSFASMVDAMVPSGSYEITVQLAVTANLYVEYDYIQDYTATMCQNEAQNGPVTVVDSRDSQKYTVQYIAGKCWMTQNLNLAISTGTTLNSSSSNVASTYTSTSPYAFAGVTGLMDDTTVSYTAPEVYNVVADASRGNGNKDYGWLYNYCAATAGTICNDPADGKTTEAQYDICPAGWRLPTNDEQQSLTPNGVQTWDKTYKDAFSPIAAGNIWEGTYYNFGTYGYWWSSTAAGANNRYYLDYGSSEAALYSGYSLNRGYGFSVRCVA